MVQGRARKDTEHTGRELLQEHLRKQGLPAQKIVGSPLLADVIREMGFRKADDFYIALGGAKISPKVVVNKVMQRLKQGEAAEGEPTAADDLLQTASAGAAGAEASSTQYGIRVEGVDDVMLRLAKCCRPVPGDPIVGYISLGRGITIHREDCPNVAALRKDPERFTRCAGTATARPRSGSRSRSTPGIATACSRTCRGRSPRPGINILEARCTVDAPDGQEPLRRRGRRHRRR